MTACNHLRVVEHDDELDAALDDAVRTLYATPPEGFLDKRSELASAAKRGGNTAMAAAIARLRKPTVAAWIVNAYVAAHPDLVGRLGEIGDQLRQAQDSLAVEQLRSLSAERRALVGGLAKDALRHADRAGASTSLHDEVSATFDAAVADPSIAASLGSLQHSEQFSGFGFGAGPSLTLVQGGGSTSTAPKRAATAHGGAASKPARPAAEQRRLDTAARTAARRLDDAEHQLIRAQEDEQTRTAGLRELEQQLEQLRQQITDARADADAATQEVASARTRRRDAAAALTKAERAAAP